MICTIGFTQNYDGMTSLSFEDAMEYLEKFEELEFDLETTGVDPREDDILLYQLGADGHAFVFNALTVPITAIKDFLQRKTFYTQNGKFEATFCLRLGIVLKPCRDTFLREAVSTNGKQFVRSAVGYEPYKRNLEALGKRYLQIEMDKTFQTRFSVDTYARQDFIQYAAEDVLHMEKIYEKQKRLYSPLGIEKCVSLEENFQVALAYVEHCGIFLDRKKWAKKVAEDEEAKRNARAALDKWVIDNNVTPFISAQIGLFSEKTCTVNWSSPTRDVPAFFKYLGFDITTTVKGEEKESVAEKVIQSIDHPIIPLYLEYKKQEKLVSTYGGNWFGYISKKTGRVHTVFTQIKNTGRVSSGRKGRKNQYITKRGQRVLIKKGTPQYPNLQNIPNNSRTRHCFVPAPGNILVVADYSSQEKAVTAQIADEKNLQRFFNEGKSDIHSFTASLITGYSYEDFVSAKKKHGELTDYERELLKARQDGKSAGFAIDYLGGAETIADSQNIPVAQAQEIYDAYLDAFPGLKPFWEECEAKFHKQGFVRISELTGRIFYEQDLSRWKQMEGDFTQDFWERYRELKEDFGDYGAEMQSYDIFLQMKAKVSWWYRTKGDFAKHSVNYRIQGTAADITKCAVVLFYRWILRNNYLNIVLIPNIVHDEILAECPIHMAEEVSRVLKDCMEKAGGYVCKKIKLKAQPVITDKWDH